MLPHEPTLILVNVLWGQPVLKYHGELPLLFIDSEVWWRRQFLLIGQSYSCKASLLWTGRSYDTEQQCLIIMVHMSIITACNRWSVQERLDNHWLVALLRLLVSRWWWQVRLFSCCWIASGSRSVQIPRRAPLSLWSSAACVGHPRSAAQSSSISTCMILQLKKVCPGLLVPGPLSQEFVSGV